MKRGAALLPQSVLRPQKKKTIAQALQVVSPTPDLLSSFSDSTPSRPDNPAPESENTSGSPQLETFCPGPNSSQPQPNSLA